MNIFAVDKNPIIAAQALDNKRVVKMILETTQLLCTALNYYGFKAMYKSTHINHPCSIWTRMTEDNFMWLLQYLQELLYIYNDEYHKQHKCYNIYLDILLHYKDNIPKGKITKFCNCTVNKDKNISFKHIQEPIEAYRNYLIARWNTDIRKPTWGKRMPPYWAIKDPKGQFIPYSNVMKILYEKE